MAGIGRLQKHVHRYWSDPTDLFGNDGANVYLWKEGTHVDGEKELHGEILMIESRYMVELKARRWV